MGERKLAELLGAGASKPPLWSRQLGLAAGLLVALLVGAIVHVELWGWRAGGWDPLSAGRRSAGGWRHVEFLLSGGDGLRPHQQSWAAAANHHHHIFGMGPASPSREMHYAMQANPGLVANDPALLEEFEAAPWLLPPHTAALPYAGVHDFDALLKLRARPAGNYSSSVALLLFSKPYAVMLQNSVYSLVKHGGVRNYIALAWSAEDLEACADLNLPCADVSSMLVEPIKTSERLLQHDFLVMMWVKPAAVLRALRHGHAVMFVDTDVAYAVKPLWESYMAFIERAEADGAWQSESPVNSGHFVVLPTPAGLAFAEAWAADAPTAIPQKVSEQKGLQPLEREAYVTCRLPCLCYRHKYELLAQGKRDSVAVFAVYLPSFFPYTGAGCTIGSKEWLPPVDPCDWTTLYLHPICVSGAANKEAIFKSAGYWFMDNEGGCLPQRGAASGVPACHPLHWRVPDAERRHYSCPSFELGLVHGEQPPAIQALRAGASADEARVLLQASADKECNGKNGPLQF